MEDLVEDGKLSLISKYPSMRRYGIAGDFRFVLIHRVFSPWCISNDYERKVLMAYEMLRYISVSAEKALGLDTSLVTMETVPLVIRNNEEMRIQRNQR